MNSVVTRTIVQGMNFFKTNEKKTAQCGQRYFAFNPDENVVLQLVVSTPPPDSSRGKTNNKGVYEILKTTFLNNYFPFDYLDECSREEYNQNFNDLTTKLKEKYDK